jgi:hypothetical protein
LETSRRGSLGFPSTIEPQGKKEKRKKMEKYEDGGSIFLSNTGIYPQVHKALQPRRPISTIVTIKCNLTDMIS